MQQWFGPQSCVAVTGLQWHSQNKIPPRIQFSSFFHFTILSPLTVPCYRLLSQVVPLYNFKYLRTYSVIQASFKGVTHFEFSPHPWGWVSNYLYILCVLPKAETALDRTLAHTSVQNTLQNSSVSFFLLHDIVQKSHLLFYPLNLIANSFIVFCWLTLTLLNNLFLYFSLTETFSISDVFSQMQ